jgi:hypothetical protein
MVLQMATNSNLRKLLEGYLPEDKIEEIENHAKEKSLKLIIRLPKGSKKHVLIDKMLATQGHNVCRVCNLETDPRMFTIDHLIPVKILEDLGLLDMLWDEDNLGILCTKCNAKKGMTLDFVDPRTVPLLEKFLQIYKARKLTTDPELLKVMAEEEQLLSNYNHKDGCPCPECSCI